MKICIDLEVLQSNHTKRGIGRYCTSLMKEILSAIEGHDIHILLNGQLENIADIKRIFQGYECVKSFEIWYAPLFAIGIENEKERRQNAALIKKYTVMSIKPDVYHNFSITEGYYNKLTNLSDLDVPCTTFLYDLIPFKFKKQYLADKGFESYLKQCVKQYSNFSTVFTLSNHVKKDAIEYLNLNPDQIEVVYGGSSFADYSSSHDELNVLAKYNLEKECFLLSAGGADFRKNLTKLIEAWGLLSSKVQAAYKLVLIGDWPEIARNEVARTISRNGMNDDQVLVLGYLADEELAEILKYCKALIFPSLDEGLGLPIIDASTFRKFTIASNIEPFKEFGLLDYQLFDPNCTKSISSVINKVIENPDICAQLVNDTIQLEDTYNWKNSAELIINNWGKIHRNYGGRDVQQRTIVDGLFADGGFVKNLSSFNSNELAELALCLDYGGMKPMDTKKRIFVDVSELYARDAKTGIQRVVKNILKRWAEYQTPTIEVLPVFSEIGEPYKVCDLRKLGISKSQKRFEYIPTYRQGDIFVLDWQAHVQIPKKEFYKSLRERGVKINFVIYDLLCVTLPEFFPRGSQELFKSWLDVVSHGDGIIAISETVMEESKTWFEKNSYQCQYDKFQFFKLGTDFASYHFENIIPSNNSTSGEVHFLLVGTIEPRKGHQEVLQAFRELWDRGLNITLTFVGKRGWHQQCFYDQLEYERQKNNKFFWYDNAEDATLNGLYGHSDCLICASYGEGFGLPIIEGAQRGLPLIVRDIPVFREVAQENATYFGTPNENLTETIALWLTEFEKGTHASSEKIKWVSWDESAIELFEKLLEN